MVRAQLSAIAEQAFSTGMGPIGVAVSGGSDSLALLHLLHEHHPVYAVTVDHGLRAASAQEAKFVSDHCADLGIAHSTLRWSGPSAQGNLMDQARRARFSLIGAWARTQGVAHVALGHTADDQAETFVMRLARESGLEGLAGMRPRFQAEGVTWHRPLLGQTREHLRDYLRELGRDWIDDPSNENPKFERVRVRQALQTLAPMGVTPGSLMAVVGHLAQAEQELTRYLSALVAAHVTTPVGDVVIDRAAFRDVFSREMQRRLINAALLWVSGADYTPRAAKLAGVLDDWETRRDFTLHGCRISVGDRVLRITREARAVQGLQVPIGAQWDRWRVSRGTENEFPVDDPIANGALSVSALGERGLLACPNWREAELPRASLLASPAIWQGENLVSAPLAGQENGWKAQIACGAFAHSLIRR
ncbi:tRNA lysidine(34) synthetase TilS [Albirhodobacter sp. R86504]|uniref:tRNA lysidine(34) synthetase TilS n=1 Tax=Albirhodobacter sp. R86504 TaxID=3093848 RepID=UPI0036707081